MTHSSTNLFLQACEAAGPLHLSIEQLAGHEEFRSQFDQPFLLVGREEWADLALNDAAVSRRHAFLQLIAGRLFCFDLESRGGILWNGQPQRCGWLAPGQAIGIGPYLVRLVGEPTADDGAPADWDPLAANSLGRGQLPAVNLEVVNGNQKGVTWRMNRVLTLVGQAPGCKVRVGDRQVGRYHCGLLRTPLGLWVIDLQMSGGTVVNREPVRWAQLLHDDRLLIGDTLLRVHYQSPPGPPAIGTLLPEVTSAAPDVPVPSVSPQELAEARAEAERLRAEWQAAQVERERLHARAGELETELLGASAARAALARAGEEAQAQSDSLRAAAEQEQSRLRDELKQVRAQLGAKERDLSEATAARAEEERGHGQTRAKAERQQAEMGQRLNAAAEARTAEEQRRSELERDLAAARSELEQLGQSLRAEQAQGEAGRAELEQSRADWDRKHADLRAQSEQSVAEVQAELKRALERACELKGELADVAAARAEVERGHSELGEDLKRALAEVERSWARATELERQLTGTEEAKTSLARAVEEALAQVAALRQQLEQAEQDHRAKQASADAALTELEEALTEARSGRAQAETQRAELEQVRTDLSNEAERLRHQIEALRQERDAVLRQLASATREHGTTPVTVYGVARANY